MENFGVVVKESASESIAEDRGAPLLGGSLVWGQEARLAVADVNWPVSVLCTSWSILSFLLCSGCLPEGTAWIALSKTLCAN